MRADLRVWYPGLWMGHSPQAFFRASCWDDDDDGEGEGKGEGEGDGGGDGGPEALLEFCLNARIISAEMSTCNANGAGASR